MAMALLDLMEPDSSPSSSAMIRQNTSAFISTANLKYQGPGNEEHVDSARSEHPQRFEPSTSMNSRNNFFREFASMDSMESDIHDHWKRNDTPSKIQASPRHTSIAVELSFDADFIDDGPEEATLPRTFLPQGVDWDYKLEEANYGTDVVIVSDDGSDVMTYSEEMQNITETKALPKPPSSQLKFTKQSHSKNSQVPSVSTSRVTMMNSSKFLKKSATKKLKVSLESSSSHSFLSAMDLIRDEAKVMKTFKYGQIMEAQNKLNTETKKKAPKATDQPWDVDDPRVEQLLRRATLEQFGHRTLSHSVDRQEFKMEDLRRITRELGSLDLRRHIMLSADDLTRFCYSNRNGTRDLVLQGKEVYGLYGRRVQDFDLPHIFAFLINNPDTVYLDLSYNNITNTGAWYIADFLSWNNTLLGLNLMNNDIDALDSHMIDAICENVTLKSLRLNGNHLGKKGGEYIAFLLMFKELEHLDLGQTDQTVESLAWITQGLMQVQSLKVLDLSRVLGYPRYDSCSIHFAIAFSDILRFCSSLVELHVSKNRITDTDLEQIVFGFSFNKRLELLDLGGNQIGDHGADMLANALRYGAPLRALMVGSNQIGDAGARALSLNLPKSQIALLDVSNNRIKDQGMNDIVNTVQKPYPLLALFIFGNAITTQSLNIIQNNILSGRLNADALDIKLFYWDGNIGHGRRSEANRYKARYYRISTAQKTETFDSKAQNVPCKPGCLNYVHHNIVNKCSIAPRNVCPSLGPVCPV